MVLSKANILALVLGYPLFTVFWTVVFWTRIAGRYQPTWESLDTRPLPDWYDNAKVGLLIHWGLFSVPSFGSERFWQEWKGGNHKFVHFMMKNYPPNFTYQDFASQFKAEFFDPKEWTEVFEASGARYIILTSKHQEGYGMWPSPYSWNWNCKDVGPNKDLVGELASAVKSYTPQIRFGVYYSLPEWFNPLYELDRKNHSKSNTYVSTKVLPELYSIVRRYQPEIIVSEDDEREPDSYWNSTLFLSWLFNESPVRRTVVVNDRWGSGTFCRHGSYFTCYSAGTLPPHKFERRISLDRHSLGYRREARLGDYLSIYELIASIAETVSCGGNILINIGPSPDGRIPPIMEERLRQVGAWLDVNGEAIYASIPWTHQNDTITRGIWYTKDKDLDRTYAIVLNWPEDCLLFLGAVEPSKETKIFLLGYETPDAKFIRLKFEARLTGITIAFPDMSEVRSKWAWVLVMSGIGPALLL
ncbi:alpha-L-fucosidase-like isoform X2 [Palaemon carinicauda]|uniref:alpha-L-fucosidase-like isoform X2 n=1 Tax=Palaemon carinicauda TaxID=392227 RepID=UPI0035B57A3E